MSITVEEREKLIELSKIIIKNKDRNFSLKNFQKDDIEESIRKCFQDILGTKELTYSYMMDRRNKNKIEECFSIIEDIMTIKLESGVLDNPFFQRFVEYRKINWGDVIQFNVKMSNSVLVTKISQGNWYVNRQRFDNGQTYTIPTERYACKVYTEFDRLLKGLVNFSDMVNDLYIAMLEKVQESVAMLFMNSFDIIPSEFKHQGNYDASELMKLVQKVQTANRNNTPIICGTKMALTKILGGYNATNSFLVSNEMKNEINNNGVLNVWHGVSLIEIPQSFKRGTFEYALPDDVLYVISGETKPIKIIQEGNTLTNYKSETDTQDQTLEWTLLQNWGVGIIMDSMYGAFKITD